MLSIELKFGKLAGLGWPSDEFRSWSHRVALVVALPRPCPNGAGHTFVPIETTDPSSSTDTSE
jgi:hypothetical protein